jgi:antitoxin StbD
MVNINLTMKNVMDSIVPITRFNRGEASRIFDELKQTGVKIVLKNNVPVGVLVEPEEYDEMVEMLEEYSQLLEAEQRVKNARQGNYIPEKQVMKDLGISESDIDDSDVAIE